MIRIKNNNTNKNAYASKVDYIHSHFELTLNINEHKIPMIFGRTKGGRFIYFPKFAEGINIDRHQSDLQVIDALTCFFDNKDSELVYATVRQFLNMEEGQEWYRPRTKKSKPIQEYQYHIPF